jgi:hypothetical protein
MPILRRTCRDRRSAWLHRISRPTSEGGGRLLQEVPRRHVLMLGGLSSFVTGGNAFQTSRSMEQKNQIYTTPLPVSASR